MTFFGKKTSFFIQLRHSISNKRLLQYRHLARENTIKKIRRKKQ